MAQVESAQRGTERKRELASPPDLFARLSTSTGLRGQGLRFLLAGGIAVAVYVATTTVLSQVIGLPFEASLAIGFALAMVTQFTLYRLFVWRHAEEFALPVHHQLARYGAMAAFNYGLTAAITGTVPHALGVSPEVPYLPTVVLLPVINFFVFRSRIFHEAIDPLHE